MRTKTMETGYPQPLVPQGAIPKLLKGQKALVTGASSGIGKAIAIALGQAGADVGVNYGRSAEAANEVVQTIAKAGVRAVAIQADVSEEDQVQAMFSKLLREFGTIGILVNDAGLQQDAPIEQMKSSNEP